MVGVKKVCGRSCASVLGTGLAVQRRRDLDVVRSCATPTGRKSALICDACMRYVVIFGCET